MNIAKKMKPVEVGIARELLRHKVFYDREVVPFFKAQNPLTISSCVGLSPALSTVVMPSVKKINTMKEAIRSVPVDMPNKLQVGMDALQWLRFVEKRLEATHHKSLTSVKFQFEVGDVVRHKALGQIGVVAAQLPLCFASDSWLVQNLGSTDDVRLAHPWYLILVSHHVGLPVDFSRYGSELTHEKVATPTSIGINRNLPLFFSGFDSEKGVYIRRRKPIVPFSARPEMTAPAGSIASSNVTLATSVQATSS